MTTDGGDRVDLRSIELFAGAGGLALGLGRVGVRAVCYVERDAYACALLVRAIEAGWLAPGPVWTDVCTFDGRPWRGAVDLVAGGFPCQDISLAGNGGGVEHGERSGLWREFARIVREVGPRFVYLENVAALVARGLDIVLGDLAALGFDASWGVFRASDAGAPHRRERLFLLAHAHRDGREGERLSGLLDRLGATSRGHTDGCGGAWPPGPGDTKGWAAYLERWPGTEPALRRGADGLADRVDRLRVLGNGVVPGQSELAFRVLWDRLMKGAQS